MPPPPLIKNETARTIVTAALMLALFLLTLAATNEFINAQYVDFKSYEVGGLKLELPAKWKTEQILPSEDGSRHASLFMQQESFPHTRFNILQLKNSTPISANNVFKVIERDDRIAPYLGGLAAMRGQVITRVNGGLLYTVKGTNEIDNEAYIYDLSVYTVDSREYWVILCTGQVTENTLPFFNTLLNHVHASIQPAALSPASDASLQQLGLDFPLPGHLDAYELNADDGETEVLLLPGSAINSFHLFTARAVTTEDGQEQIEPADGREWLKNYYREQAGEELQDDWIVQGRWGRFPVWHIRVHHPGKPDLAYGFYYIQIRPDWGLLVRTLSESAKDSVERNLVQSLVLLAGRAKSK